eukprot:TRINITY_DN24652_c2_g1_i1.p1 TRINITY_DN24652_c2_g1~~TRINITY_DN24652_c2_g1_i1.p1  ORF type:complete len:115 (+),score=1.08 TRINITY_DN24652_c2_g1_i1:326-670(+)
MQNAGNASRKTNQGLGRIHRGAQVPLHYLGAQVSPLWVVMHLRFLAIFRRDFQHFATKRMALILITDVRTIGSKSNDTRIQIQGADPFGRDLGASTVAPKCIVFSFLLFFFLSF